jgi:hypothetical protein
MRPSRIVQTLNVPQRLSLGPLLAATLLDGLLEQPTVRLEPSVIFSSPVPQTHNSIQQPVSQAYVPYSPLVTTLPDPAWDRRTGSIAAPPRFTTFPPAPLAS